MSLVRIRNDDGQMGPFSGPRARGRNFSYSYEVNNSPVIRQGNKKIGN